ncbi:hypothetical protein PABG_03735 [Paracoccidioides brasiliensis Pb03]|nr:hypothetical protein PABG_03735 [Paracoccidioides brasiliensis Pb03]
MMKGVGGSAPEAITKIQTAILIIDSAFLKFGCFKTPVGTAVGNARMRRTAVVDFAAREQQGGDVPPGGVKE